MTKENIQNATFDTTALLATTAGSTCSKCKEGTMVYKVEHQNGSTVWGRRYECDSCGHKVWF